MQYFTQNRRAANKIVIVSNTKIEHTKENYIQSREFYIPQTFEFDTLYS